MLGPYKIGEPLAYLRLLRRSPLICCKNNSEIEFAHAQVNICWYAATPPSSTIATRQVASMDEALRPGKAAYILDQILEAQNQSYLLGLKLNLAQHDVEAIHTMYLEPKDRLLHVLIAFLKHVEPTPTWRVILDALRTPSVNLQELARRVERAHFPDSTPSPRQQISSKSILSQVCIIILLPYSMFI